MRIRSSPSSAQGLVTLVLEHAALLGLHSPADISAQRQQVKLGMLTAFPTMLKLYVCCLTRLLPHLVQDYSVNVDLGRQIHIKT